jgi:hypothetical protein
MTTLITSNLIKVAVNINRIVCITAAKTAKEHTTRTMVGLGGDTMSTKPKR